MKPILEYVRQLNQQSITLRSEWLERLQHVEVSASEISSLPEIEFSKANALRVSDSREHEPPVTVVRPAGIPGSRPNSWADVNAKTASPDLSLWSESATQVVNPANSLRDLLGGALQVNPGVPIKPAMDVSPAPSQTAPSGPVAGSQPSPRRERIDAAHASEDTLHAHSVPAEVRREAVLHNQSAVLISRPDSRFRLDSQMAATFVQNPVPEIVLTASARLAPAAPGKTAGSAAGDSRLAAVKRPWLKTTVSEKDLERVDHQSPGSKAIDKIADQILSRFPVTAPSSIVLCSFQRELDIDSISAKLATCLATREIGHILLVDANGQDGELSKIMGTSASPGLTELVAETRPLNALVGTTDNPNLDFLPWGNSELTLRKLDPPNATRIISDFNHCYRYSILCGRALPDPFSRLWCEFADAVYLVVNLERIDRDDLSRRVQQLRSHAIRVAGLITVEEA
jgi:hypothetical protein